MKSPMQYDLVIIGAWGEAIEIIEAVMACNASAPVWNLVGILDEEDLLLQVYQDASFDGVTADIMAKDLRTVGPDDTLDRVLLLLTKGMVVPVVSGKDFHGLITKIDVLNHLRLHAASS